VWEGTDPLTHPDVLSIPFPLTSYRVRAVRLEIETKRHSGWEEIDAVQLVGPDGALWASGASASSTYGQGQKLEITLGGSRAGASSRFVLALAAPRVATVARRRNRKDRVADGASREPRRRIVCFPEAYLPACVARTSRCCPSVAPSRSARCAKVGAAARKHAIAAIVGMERLVDEVRQIAAWVFDAQGQLSGLQTKNQIAPSEDAFYVPGTQRQVFEVAGLRFGIAICHEGWRYPRPSAGPRSAAHRSCSIRITPAATARGRA
jgi:hypothetical protein